MKKIISFFHISLDGFVAGPQGEMDWITINEEIFTHVGKRIQLGDTSLYGRKTFEMMEGYWPTAAEQPNPTAHTVNHARWYSQVHKVVLSKTLDGAALKNTTIIKDPLSEQLREIRQSGNGEDILLFGSPTATHALLELGLIDGFWLFVNPIVLGEGIPLFEPGQEKLKLQLQHSHSFNCGVIEQDYVVVR